MAKDTQHVVCSDGMELDVTYEVDDKTGSERITAKGFKRFDGEDFEGTLMAPKGRPAVGYQWMAVGEDVTGQTFHFLTEPVTKVGDDDTPADHEVPHVNARHGEPGAAPKDLAEKTAGVKQSAHQREASEKRAAEAPARAKQHGATEAKMQARNRAESHGE